MPDLKPIEIATLGTYAGTTELLQELIDESKHHFGWRPVRAAALYALRDAQGGDGRVWMSGERLAAWRAEAKALAKVRGLTQKPHEILGLSLFQIRQLEQKPDVGKPLALACAHFAMGLPMPIPAEDAREFDLWFRPRFAGSERIATWLDINSTWLTDRLRGYEIIREERRERLPPAYLIRALDLVWKAGPFCPYGDARPVPLWTNQAVEGLG